MLYAYGLIEHGSLSAPGLFCDILPACGMQVQLLCTYSHDTVIRALTITIQQNSIITPAHSSQTITCPSAPALTISLRLLQ